ncbi:MAG: lysophospholipid acyltransferase family protein [Candidatus Omnitrophica bacterium]|nr:lysophospholipid acyltransferase family protein [Candidatus Omnitrophota bacterium]
MRVIPRRLIDFFMEGLLFFVYMWTKNIKQICVRNLQLVYRDSKDKKEYEQIARQYIKSIGVGMMDLLYYVQRPHQLLKIVHFECENNLKKALESGRGVIAVSAHLGNFPLMFVSLVQKGYKVNVIIRNMRDENFGRFIHQLCDRCGINMITTTPPKQFLKKSLEALKRNELLFILLDEAVEQENAVKVNFLNREAMRATGPILFFERTRSPVLPMFIVKDEKKHFKIFIEQPFETDKGKNAQESIVNNITGLSRIIEHFVIQYPYQWGGWFNKRWSLDAKFIAQSL